MGMHSGVIVVTGQVDALREAFITSGSGLNVVASAELPSPDALAAWSEAHSRFVSAADATPTNRPVSVHALRQEGPRAVLLDPTYLVAGDEALLADLSRRFGRVVSIVIETTSASALLWVYEDGELVRSVQSGGDEIETVGDPVAEEDGFAPDAFYMDEVEAILRRLEVKPWEPLPDAPYLALAIAERMEVPSHGAANVTSTTAGTATTATAVTAATTGSLSAPSHSTKPWWKFW